MRWNAEHGSGLAGKLLPPRVCSRHPYNDESTAAKPTRTVLLTIFFNFSAHKHRGGSGGPEVELCVSMKGLIGIKALLVQAPAVMATGG